MSMLPLERTLRGGRTGAAKTMALTALCAGLLVSPAIAEEPSAADIAAVKACTDMVDGNQKNRPLH